MSRYKAYRSCALPPIALFTPLLLLAVCCLVSCGAARDDSASWSSCWNLPFSSYLTTADSDAAVDQSPALLLLIVDSLRWDFVSDWLSKDSGFDLFKRQGAHVEQVTPVFPAECYPNLYSMFTGTFPVEHGAIFGTVYNDTNQQLFSYANPNKQAVLQRWLKQNVFWQRNEDLVKSTRVFHLPICTSEEIESGRCEPYNVDAMTPKGLESTLTQALSELVSGQSKVAVVYYDELDRVGHKYGPLSPEMLAQSLPRLASLLGKFVFGPLGEANSGLGGGGGVNLVITSDHGMTQVDRSASIMPITKFGSIKHLINRGSTLAIWPFEDKQDELLDRLSSADTTKFRLYTRANLPQDWQTGGDLFPPILLVANQGVQLDFASWPLHIDSYNSTSNGGDSTSGDRPKGLHGYDPSLDDMKVPLLALGPSFEPGSRIDDRTNFTQLDSHALISWLVELATNSPSTVESTVDFKSLLRSPYQHTSLQERRQCRFALEWILVLSTAILLAIIIIGSIINLCYLRRHQHRSLILCSKCNDDQSQNLINPTAFEEEDEDGPCGGVSAGVVNHGLKV